MNNMITNTEARKSTETPVAIVLLSDKYVLIQLPS